MLVLLQVIDGPLATPLYAVAGAVVAMAGFVGFLVKFIMDQVNLARSDATARHAESMKRIDVSQSDLTNAVDSLTKAVDSLHQRDTDAGTMRLSMMAEQRLIGERLTRVEAQLTLVLERLTSKNGNA